MKFMSGPVSVCPMHESHDTVERIKCSACETEQRLYTTYEGIECGDADYAFCPRCYPKVMQQYMDYMTDAKTKFYSNFIKLPEK